MLCRLRFPVLVVLVVAAACGSSGPAITPPPVVAAAAVGTTRCDVVLRSTSSEEERRVLGFGHDSGEAASNARMMAVHLAETLDRTSLWLELLAQPDQADGVAERLLATFASQAYEEGVPVGWQVTSGECSSQQEHAPGRVRVTWNDNPIAVEDGSLAAAIEKARRVGCNSAWADTFSNAFRALAQLSPEERASGFAVARDGIRARVAQCVTAGEYEVGEAAHPSTRRQQGAQFCHVTLAPAPRASFAAQAYGPSRSMALHRAALRALQVAFGTADQTIALAMRSGDPAERATMAAAAISNAVTAAKVESLATTVIARCAAVEDDGASWQSEDCGRERVEGTAPSLCDAQRAAMATTAREAIAGVDEADRHAITLGAWGDVQGCAAACRSEYRLGDGPELLDTHASHCASIDSARATFLRGVERQNAAEVFHCASVELTGMLMQGFAERPERVWEGLVRVAGAPDQLLADEVHGAVRLSIHP